MTENHELFTRMLFVDAIVGLGFPELPAVRQIAEHAVRGGLARRHADGWSWERDALENLALDTLQTLYTSIKTYEVTHAG